MVASRKKTPRLGVYVASIESMTAGSDGVLGLTTPPFALLAPRAYGTQRDIITGDNGEAKIRTVAAHNLRRPWLVPLREQQRQNGSKLEELASDTEPGIRAAVLTTVYEGIDTGENA